jgi:Rrf2 family iron-sulfur cluster assembly transcriptional regulator
MTLVSKPARYALHGVGYIARHCQGGPVPFPRILDYLKTYSQRLTLSAGYIAKVFQKLSRAGITEAVPGPRGGYRLARSAADIRLIEIIEAVDGPLRSDCCLLSMGSCEQRSSCGVGDILRGAEQVFYEFFETGTVAKLAEKMSFPEEPGPR